LLRLSGAQKKPESRRGHHFVDGSFRREKKLKRRQAWCHLSAEVFRELDRKRANASSACGDEHLVAGLEVGCVFLQLLALVSRNQSK
jgi:hypothetical protein